MGYTFNIPTSIFHIMASTLPRYCVESEVNWIRKMFLDERSLFGHWLIKLSFQNLAAQTSKTGGSCCAVGNISTTFSCQNFKGQQASQCRNKPGNYHFSVHEVSQFGPKTAIDRLIASFLGSPSVLLHRW